MTTTTDPHAGFSMFSPAGNAACAKAVAKAVKDAEAGRLTRKNLRARYHEILDSIAKKHSEVYDTEPEWAIADALNDLICKPQMWVSFSRWGDSE